MTTLELDVSDYGCKLCHYYSWVKIFGNIQVKYYGYFNTFNSLNADVECEM